MFPTSFKPRVVDTLFVWSTWNQFINNSVMDASHQAVCTATMQYRCETTPSLWRRREPRATERKSRSLHCCRSRHVPLRDQPWSGPSPRPIMWPLQCLHSITSPCRQVPSFSHDGVTSLADQMASILLSRAVGVKRDTLNWRDHLLQGSDLSSGVPASSVFKRLSHVAHCRRQTEMSYQLWLLFELEQHQGRVLHS